MQEKFMVISPYKEFEEKVNEIAAEFTYEPFIIDGEKLDEDFKNNLDHLLHNHFNPDVIIGRGVATTYASKIFTSAAVVRMEPNFTDILYALKKARNHGNKVGIIAYSSHGIKENISILKEIFDFKEISIYLFENSIDMESQVIKAKKDGMNSIIGGGTIAYELALSHHIPATFIEISRSGIESAIEQSISIIESRKKDRELLDNILSLINCMNEGLLATKDNKVLVSNLKLDDIINIPVREYFNQSITLLNENIGNFIAQEGLTKDIIKINGKNYLVEKLNNTVSFADNIIIFHNVSELQDKEVNVRRKLHANKFIAKKIFKDIIGSDPKIVNIINNASIYAKTDAEVLIEGETGTGKEFFAQSIHNDSSRRDNPFIAVNCGAIPEQLLESELFGYVDGAFSGAKKGGKTGLFELAHKGTLFLDEINSLPIMLQGKLLRVIQEKTLRRIGSETETFIDVRILSASNKGIDLLIQKNEFRSDLFHRINTLTLQIPSLKERIEDIEILANYFINIYSKKYDKRIPRLKPNEINLLKSYHWPGNVRELENVIHRYVILYHQANSNSLTSDFITNYNGNVTRSAEDHSSIIIKKDNLENMEREIIVSFLNEHKWNRKEVAEKLGISRSTLWRKFNN
ncbi:sigma 54-interacting transcriptional regulator [Pseudoneobacillus rhizosphaerae]|uniref:Anaerobic nitric oxide reductase transcription regulator NorR n=1 Tax=Pseudoneobacillus rhizosphaerae TaxID=2880968 RepID=A0A9C7GAY5_9BACI|nr:sigma 54-interacting transcriptional regulator [Pseudoneobacillus rhizosphaerae]CAG9609026.1 Anaerobic nitric oxide reductase transcription regulator NorR [Pseudoneobacillus rhizosphaerae]